MTQPRKPLTPAKAAYWRRYRELRQTGMAHNGALKAAAAPGGPQVAFERVYYDRRDAEAWLEVAERLGLPYPVGVVCYLRRCSRRGNRPTESELRGYLQRYAAGRGLV